MTAGLPISLPEYERDREILDRLEAENDQAQRDWQHKLRQADGDLRQARVEAWQDADGKHRDERVAQVEAAVREQKRVVLQATGMLELVKQRGFVLSNRSQRLVTSARFAIRQMELDTPGPDRAPHWERT